MNSRQPAHQLVHTLSYGDAISTEVLAMQRALRGLGHASEIYAIGEHPQMRGRSRPYKEVLDQQGADLILHYSLGSPLNELYAAWSRGRRILVYHNITPASWYNGINRRVALDIERGLLELPEICASSDVIWADSPFNAAELGTLGFAAEVLELPIDPQRWDLPRNEGVFNIVRGMQELHLLHVGRLAPNKCIEDIIKSFYFLYTHITKKSRLWLVGIDTDTELYSFSLRDLTQRLGIEHAVEFRGCMADEEVRAMYEACSVYLCMSEHEGFCLPIIEAMHFGLPVIGYGAGAVPDTIGAGGVIVREKRYAEMAQLMYELAKPGEFRSKVIEAGRQRVQDFSYERFTARLAELLHTLQDSARACAV